MKILKIVFMMCIFVNCFTITSDANSNCNNYRVYYLDTTAEENLIFKEYDFNGEFTLDTKISLILEDFLNDDDIIYIPDGTKIINTYLIMNDLIINFSSDIKNYGGTHYEINLLRQILYNVFQYDDIENVTFIVEDKFEILPEGSVVYRYTRDDLEALDHR